MSMDTEQLKLEPEEAVLRLVRKHWFILLCRTAGIVFGGLAPLILITLILASDTGARLVPNIHLFYKPAVFFGTAWSLMVWMVLFGSWTDYYLDMWLITNKRVIAIDQRGFFNRSVASFRLERLQDITVDIRGIIPTLLDFGTVKADTASHSDVFVIRGAPRPREIKSLIQEHADQAVVAPHIRI